MKKRILLFFSIYIFFILIFFIQKIFFITIDSVAGSAIAFSDFFEILYHGLPLDMSMSGYLSVLPALFLIASVWVKPQIISKIFNVYFVIILTLVALIAVVDIVVYPYWGFHFDSTVFLYLQKPKEVLASASAVQIVLGTLIFLFVAFVLCSLYWFTLRKIVLSLELPKYNQCGKTALVLLILTAALFLPIRGGVTVSTMNVGKAYYSDNMFFNHAAINPIFNLMSSFVKSEDFGSQYQFYDKDEAIAIFESLNNQPDNDTIPRLLNTDKPNILLFILESFSANIAYDSVVAPNMYRFAQEGINFDNFYANSYRTDRGLVSVLSGYPAQPTTAIIKYPNKTNSLPSIPKSLRGDGYNLSFYYGGDADFANMRSYMVGTCETRNIISDSEFPISQRLTKWGVPDAFLMNRVYQDIEAKTAKEPFLKTILTLSSHEPFDVPTKKFDVPFLNAAHYTDSCLGEFVEKLKKTDVWKNTLIIFVADHAMQSYPTGVNNHERVRFHIPLIWIGGAVKEHRTISDYGSQNDIAATLLSQLNVSAKDFKFSKNMLNPDSHKFAFYSYVNGFSMLDSTNVVLYDNDQKKLLEQKGDPNIEKSAKAFFQNMYLDLGQR